MAISINDISAAKKTAKFQYPGHDKFNLELAFLPASEWQKIRRNCVKIQFNKKHQPEEIVDDEKWMRAFIEAVFVGWEGLTLDILTTIAPVSIKGSPDKETPIPFSVEFAKLLLEESREFSEWVMAIQDSYQNFIASAQEEVVKN